MNIDDSPTVSEEQVLFNKLGYEEQQFILKQMKLLQPCEEISCEILEEEKKIPEKLNLDTYATIGTEVDKDVIIKINEIIDYLKSKGGNIDE